APANSVWS
uniref:Conophan gld-V n=1 Tax=Conus gladiator TaxID=257327 RepID=CONO_CONGA|nr:RecName: Full=Conophan gld-V; AltName: Full=Gamma-hydroxyconophan gld-V* [Conus gladiator]